jgi:hypothetical protein
MFNEQVKNTTIDADIFYAVAHASEFENIRQRDEEMEELGRLEEESSFLEVQRARRIRLILAKVCKPTTTSCTKTQSPSPRIVQCGESCRQVGSQQRRAR